MVKTWWVLPPQGVQIRFLVGEQRPCTPWTWTKKKPSLLCKGSAFKIRRPVSIPNHLPSLSGLGILEPAVAVGKTGPGW